MNKKLQNEIREFIGDDPAQAVERVRECGQKARELLDKAVNRRFGDSWESKFIKGYGLAAYGAGLAAVMALEIESHFPKVYVKRMLAIAATADAETRIAAMLWAAAWIVEVNENDPKRAQGS